MAENEFGLVIRPCLSVCGTLKGIFIDSPIIRVHGYFLFFIDIYVDYPADGTSSSCRRFIAHLLSST